MRRRGRPPHPDILTPREWEVLALIERGASNDEIANALGVTERTAKYHVSEILSKLGVSSREEVVAAVGERSARVGVAGWALFVRVAAALAAGALLVGVVFLAWGVLQGGDDSDVPADITVEELYSRVLTGATRSDQILHTTFEQTFSESSGNERQLYIGDYWLDVTSDTVRAETHPGRDNTSDDAGDSLFMFQGPYQYYQESENKALREDSKALCPGSTSAVLGVLFACGYDPGLARGDTTVRTDAEWEGHRAVAVDTLFTPASGIPSPTLAVAPMITPLATAGQTVVTAPPLAATTAASGEPVLRGVTSTLYLDASTFLPLAYAYGYDFADPQLPNSLVLKYYNEFVERSSLPADYFDPHSIGYGTGAATGQLTDLSADVPVYWLGQEVSPPGLGELVLTRVSPATAQFPAELRYQAPIGYPDVYIELWQPAAWTAYFAAARSAFLDDTRCTTESQITADQYTADVFTLPNVSFGVPVAGSCGDRLLNLGTIPPANYFSYVDLGEVVVELRAFRSSEYDSTNGIRTLLTLLHPFIPG